ncbi:MAG: TetR/AcrR family transcriptional regulator [Propionibacteriaceae bacterium]|nr:TetR/AcrR family transcriptional regulator [Propionibacteriaceae bacterium]
MAGRPPGDSADGKQRLLDACWSLLVDTPQGERLTIAAVCERARCTPPTLYHHFGDLASLERAASRRAYLAWSTELAHTCSHIVDPKARLDGHARAYVAWAQKHPDAYNVLFSQPRKEVDPNTSSLDAPIFLTLLTDLGEIHQKLPSDPSLLPLAMAYWAGVHGVASLATTLPYFPENVQESTLDIMTAALATHTAAESPDWAHDMARAGHTLEEDGLRAAS